VHTHQGWARPGRVRGPAVDIGGLAQTRSGLDYWESLAPCCCYFRTLLLSTFNTLQATVTTHLGLALCDVTALVLLFFAFCGLLVFLFGISYTGER
jgi:hypothetical protein